MVGLSSKLSVTSGCTNSKKQKNARNQGNKLWSDNNRSRKDVLTSAKAAHTLHCCWRKCSAVFDQNNLSRCRQNKGLSVIACQFCSASVRLKMWVHSLFLLDEWQKKCPLTLFLFWLIIGASTKSLVKNLKIRTRAVWSTDRCIWGRQVCNVTIKRRFFRENKCQCW